MIPVPTLLICGYKKYPYSLYAIYIYNIYFLSVTSFIREYSQVRILLISLIAREKYFFVLLKGLFNFTVSIMFYINFWQDVFYVFMKFQINQIRYPIVFFLLYPLL